MVPVPFGSGYVQSICRRGHLPFSRAPAKQADFVNASCTSSKMLICGVFRSSISVDLPIPSFLQQMISEPPFLHDDAAQGSNEARGARQAEPDRAVSARERSPVRAYGGFLDGPDASDSDDGPLSSLIPRFLERFHSAMTQQRMVGEGNDEAPAAAAPAPESTGETRSAIPPSLEETPAGNGTSSAQQPARPGPGA